MKAKVENRNRKNERGFTLIETSISMVVMMVAGLAVSSLFVFSTQNNVGGNERALAMAVAQQQMEQLRSVTFESSTLNAGTTTSTVRSADRDYTVVKAITDETNPDGTIKRLRRITITVTPLGGARANWTRTPVTLVALRSTVAAGDFAVQ
jgi:Tfp pilus assembly protein PilV